MAQLILQQAGVTLHLHATTPTTPDSAHPGNPDTDADADADAGASVRQKRPHQPWAYHVPQRNPLTLLVRIDQIFLASRPLCIGREVLDL